MRKEFDMEEEVYTRLFSKWILRCRTWTHNNIMLVFIKFYTFTYTHTFRPTAKNLGTIHSSSSPCHVIRTYKCITTQTHTWIDKSAPRLTCSWIYTQKCANACHSCLSYSHFIVINPVSLYDFIVIMLITSNHDY